MYTYEISFHGLDGSIYKRTVKADGIVEQEHGIALVVDETEDTGELFQTDERIVAFFTYENLLYVIREEPPA